MLSQIVSSGGLTNSTANGLYIRIDGTNTGTPNTGDMLWFTGGVWTRFPRPASAFTYVLNNNNAGNLVWNIQSISATPTWAQTLGASNISNAHNPQLTTTDQLQFRDTTNYIYSSVLHNLDLVADRTMTFTAPTSYAFSSLTSNGLIKTTGGTGTLAIATGGTDYENPLTFSTGLTRTTNTITNNLSVGVSGGQTAIGGTANADTLTLKATTGIGTAANAAIILTGGTNGGTTLATFSHNNKLGIGAAPGAGSQLIQLFANTANGLRSNSYSVAPSTTNSFIFARGRGTIATPATTVSGDVIFNITGQGYDTAGTPILANTGVIQMVAEGTIGSGNVPGRIMFNTTPTGGGTNSIERMFINNGGQVVSGMTQAQVAIALSNEKFIHNAVTETDNVLAVLGIQDSDLPTVYSGDLQRWGVYDLFTSSGGTVGEYNYAIMGPLGKFTKYDNIATQGKGVPTIYKVGRSIAQTAANTSVVTYTTSATDGTFIVSANANITSFIAGTFNVTVDYTDETGTGRTLTLNFSSITGTIGIALAAVGPFEGVPAHIRCKASTAITFKTAGTFTSLTYNVEGVIQQLV